MKLAIGCLGAIASLMILPAESDAAESCTVSGGREIPVETVYDFEPYENGFVRRQADLYFDSQFERKVGEARAGSYVMASAQAFDEDCDMWVFVTFPVTESQAWIRAVDVVFMGPVD